MTLRAFLLAVAGATSCGAAPAADGPALFRQHCATCHQETGVGTPGLAPPLLGDHWKKLGAERPYILTVALKGLSGPIKVNGQPFVGAMPGLEAQLKDDEVAAIANHVRGLQGTPDAGYGADDVAAVRKAPGDQSRTRAMRRAVLGE